TGRESRRRGRDNPLSLVGKPLTNGACLVTEHNCVRRLSRKRIARDTLVALTCQPSRYRNQGKVDVPSERRFWAPSLLAHDSQPRALTLDFHSDGRQRLQMRFGNNHALGHEPNAAWECVMRE